MALKAAALGLTAIGRQLAHHPDARHRGRALRAGRLSGRLSTASEPWQEGSLAGCCHGCRSATVEWVRSGSGVMESTHVASGLGALEGATDHASNNDWRPGS